MLCIMFKSLSDSISCNSNNQQSKSGTSAQNRIMQTMNSASNPKFSSPKSKKSNLSGNTRNDPHYITPLMPSRKKMSSRAHLVNSRVLQKTAVLIYGLPKKEFQTTKDIEREFKKYGVITNCLKNPKGMSLEGIVSKSSTRNEDTGTVYIRYLTEKAATNAILATNGQSWGNTRLHARFVNNRYCDEFLNGRYCQDLNCILLHEVVKLDKRRQIWKTPKKIYPKVSDRSVSTVTNQEAHQQSNLCHEESAMKKMNSIKSTVDSQSNTTGYDKQFTIITPSDSDCNNVSMSTPPLSVIDHSSCLESANHQINILSATNCINNEERVKYADLPARQLFKKTAISTCNSIIGPPKVSRETSLVTGINSPWSLKSPVMIEKDNFDEEKPPQETKTTTVRIDEQLLGTNCSAEEKNEINSSFDYQSIDGVKAKSLNYYPEQRNNQGYNFNPYCVPSVSNINYPHFMPPNYYYSYNDNSYYGFQGYQHFDGKTANAYTRYGYDFGNQNPCYQSCFFPHRRNNFH